MVAELIAEESYGEDSLRAQYLISPETGQLRKERLYEVNGWTSVNKFIKVEICYYLLKFVQNLSLQVSCDMCDVQTFYCYMLLGCLSSSRISQQC